MNSNPRIREHWDFYPVAPTPRACSLVRTEGDIGASLSTIGLNYGVIQTNVLPGL